MARKGRESLTEAPPPADSSSEENDSDSDEYESTSEEEGDNQTQQPQQTPKKPDQPTKPQVSESDSGTDSNTESDTDSDADPKPTPFEHPKSKPTSLPAPNASNKRKNTDAETSDKVLTPKKVKKDKSDPSGSIPIAEESGKKLFQRVWSEDDEIVILKGLIDFKAKKGKNPMSDVDGFIDFIKSSLHVADVKKEQIVSKVRRLKGRYETAKKRNLTNPHELQAFELSKTIWGGSDDGVDENNNEMSAKSPLSKAKSKASNVKSKGVKNAAVNGGVLIDGGKKVEDADEKTKGDEKIKADEGTAASGGVIMTMSVSQGIQLGELNKFGNIDEKFMNEGLKRLDVDERDALEEEWRNFNVSQMEVLVKRLELYHKTAKSLLNAVKSSKR